MKNSKKATSKYCVFSYICIIYGNFEVFCWNFLWRTNLEIGRSEWRGSVGIYLLEDVSFEKGSMYKGLYWLKFEKTMSTPYKDFSGDIWKKDQQPTY